MARIALDLQDLFLVLESVHFLDGGIVCSLKLACCIGCFTSNLQGKRIWSIDL